MGLRLYAAGIKNLGVIHRGFSTYEKKQNTVIFQNGKSL
jgi:hypothetical protein